MITPILITHALLKKTLEGLQEVGKRGSECVHLWLGKRSDESIQVDAVWVPDQIAGEDFFEIPEHAMEALFAEIRPGRRFVAAQIHTHPLEAFHSAADDKWAIVRHTGALSLVLPYFAAHTDVTTFVRDTAVFVLTAGNRWVEVPEKERKRYYQIIE